MLPRPMRVFTVAIEYDAVHTWRDVRVQLNLPDMDLFVSIPLGLIDGLSPQSLQYLHLASVSRVGQYFIIVALLFWRQKY